MEENKRIVILYILLILIFSLLFVYEKYIDRKNDVDRKVDKLFNKYTYNEAVEISNNLFINAMELLNTNNLKIEINNAERIKYYVFDNKTYKKIIEDGKMLNTFAHKDLEKYIEMKKIINRDNNYYIEDYVDEYNKDYIGSMLNVKEYNDKEIVFNSINYYLKDGEYKGLFDEEPIYDSKKEIEFRVVFEDSILKITDIDKLMEIIA